MYKYWSIGVALWSKAPSWMAVILLLLKSSRVRLSKPRNAFLLMDFMSLLFKLNVSSLVSGANGPNESSIVTEMRFWLKSSDSKLYVALSAPELMADIWFACKSRIFNLLSISNVPTFISVNWFCDKSKWVMRCVNSQQFLPIVWMELLDKFNLVSAVIFRSPPFCISVKWLFAKSLNSKVNKRHYYFVASRQFTSSAIKNYANSKSTNNEHKNKNKNNEFNSMWNNGKKLFTKK